MGTQRCAAVGTQGWGWRASSCWNRAVLVGRSLLPRQCMWFLVATVHRSGRVACGFASCCSCLCQPAALLLSALLVSRLCSKQASYMFTRCVQEGCFVDDGCREGVAVPWFGCVCIQVWSQPLQLQDVGWASISCRKSHSVVSKETAVFSRIQI